MQVHLGMFEQKLLHQGGFVRGEIVEDHVDLAFNGLGGNDVLQESDKLFTGVTRGRLSDHSAGFRIECRIKRQGSMAVILETMLFGPSWR